MILRTFENPINSLAARTLVSFQVYDINCKKGDFIIVKFSSTCNNAGISAFATGKSTITVELENMTDEIINNLPQSVDVAICKESKR